MLSGLGADKRLFSKINFPAEVNVIHVEWIAPYKKDTIATYAKRLSSTMDFSCPFYLVGLSFGGMVASEIARISNPVGTIIISSASSAKGIPWYYKIAGKIYLPELLPFSFMKQANAMTYWLFGAMSKEQKEVLKDVLNEMDKNFLRWAMMAITQWRSTDPLQGLYHIHGNEDRILPLQWTEADHIIKGGGHLMVYSHAEKITDLISSKISV